MLNKIVILGHKGFIGQHLERRILANGKNVAVIGKDLPEVDLTNKDDVMAMADLFSVNTTVILLATIKRQFGDTLDAFNQNLKITTNLCSLLEEKPVGRFVFFSSAAVYGEDIHNIATTEETPIVPTSYYGMAKFISEWLFHKTLNQNPQSSFLVVRPPVIYGPGDNGMTYGPVKFTNEAIKKEDTTLWGDGSELREFIYIDDAVDIVTKLIFGSFNGVVNLASGTSYSFRDILDIVESISGSKLNVNSRPRSKDKVDNVFLNDRLLDQIGSYSFTPLSKGIQTLYDHLNSGEKKEEKDAEFSQA